MAITIITDSASDILQTEAKTLGIEVIPLITIFPDKSYRDGVDISHNQFFELLIESDELPTTSQITPHAYGEAFDAALEKGNEVLCLTISSKLSGCYQSACIAQQERPDKPIYIVDTLSATFGERILVEYALRLRSEGHEASYIAAELEKAKKKVKVVALLDTLDYLKKGGRISATVALAGTLLSIKPVIAVEDGVIAVLGKARGSKNGNNFLIQEIEKSAGIDFDMPFSLAYSGLSDTLLKKYIKDSTHIYEGIPADELPVRTIGSTIGTHIGPGAIGLAFFEK
ncbi:MAG: DegV family protein [Anaerotardibacter sp.]